MRDCAFGALKTGEDAYPAFAHPERCMRCQHCFAICPKGAIAFAGHRPGEAVANDGSVALPTGEEVMNWLRFRRSVRSYREGDVDRATLGKILHSLGNVPTGCNARGLTFTCFPTHASLDGFKARFLKAIEEHREGTRLLPRWLAVPAIKMRRGGPDLFFRGAGGLLIVSSDERNPSVTTPHEDIIATLAAFEFLAEAHGFGTCWFGFLKKVQQAVPELLEKALGFRRETPFYAMLFGLPAVRYARSVVRENDAAVDWRD